MPATKKSDPTATIDRALAALGTEDGERRVKQHLTESARDGSAEAIDVNDLVAALRELRRRS